MNLKNIFKSLLKDKNLEQRHEIERAISESLLYLLYRDSNKEITKNWVDVFEKSVNWGFDFSEIKK